jgi:hypothetical protein
MSSAVSTAEGLFGAMAAMTSCFSPSDIVPRNNGAVQELSVAQEPALNDLAVRKEGGHLLFRSFVFMATLAAALVLKGVANQP